MSEPDATDPRVTDEYSRAHTGEDTGGDVVLVGVVHDHPASRHRVQQVVRDCAPDVVGLEVPPIAVPLFEVYADDERTPPAFGGEMSTAIQAAETDRVVGIDGPSVSFLGTLITQLAREAPSPGTTRRVLESLLSVTTEAIRCRLAATLAAWTGCRIEVDQPASYDCTVADDPATQAEDERANVRRAETILNTFGTSAADDCHRHAREAHMSDRLSTLRQEGDVVAVVGMGHLDPLADRLAEQ